MAFIKKQKGAALLISVLVLSALMLGFSLTASTISLRETRSGIALEEHTVADAAAMACMEYAIYRLGRFEIYAGSETLVIGGVTCTVRPIVSGATWTIETESAVGDAYARYRVILDSRAPPSIASWEPVLAF